MVLGTYLKRYQTSVSRSRFLTCCAAVLLFSALLFVLRSFLHILPAGFIYDNLSFISIVYVYTIFTIIQYASRFITRVQPVFTELSKHSFGIYLSHILIIHFITQPLISSLALPPYAAIPLMAVIPYLCCYISIKLLTFLPKSKYIVGI